MYLLLRNLSDSFSLVLICLRFLLYKEILTNTKVLKFAFISQICFLCQPRLACLVEHVELTSAQGGTNKNSFDSQIPYYIKKCHECVQSMAQHFNIIIFSMQLIALWHSYVCEINTGTNIHEILESHLMPMDLFTLCAKCRLRNKISYEFTAVLHLMTYHR